MFIQSCPWSGRVPSSTSTIYQHPPALFHVRDCSQATSAYPFLGLKRLVRYVVRCLTAGATTPSHVAAVVSGWSDSRVSAFLHLARQRACWWVCAVARFCLDRMGGLRLGLLELVSASCFWVGGWSDFCKKASAKESRDQIIGVRQSGVDACVHPLVLHGGCQAACALASA